MELRYPITLNNQHLYICTWILQEAGSAFKDFKAYNPFSKQISVGLRVFMPAFGLLGIDFDGFDALQDKQQMDGKPISLSDNSSKQHHFKHTNSTIMKTIL
jgi:outer membrane protein insertion porin family